MTMHCDFIPNCAAHFSAAALTGFRVPVDRAVVADPGELVMPDITWNGANRGYPSDGPSTPAGDPEMARNRRSTC